MKGGENNCSSLSLAHLLWEEEERGEELTFRLSFFLAVPETGEVDPKLLATVHLEPSRDASHHNTAASSENAKSGKTTFLRVAGWTRSRLPML